MPHLFSFPLKNIKHRAILVISIPSEIAGMAGVASESEAIEITAINVIAQSAVSRVSVLFFPARFNPLSPAFLDSNCEHGAKGD